MISHTNDGDIVLGSLELPQSNVDGDTTLTLGLELVKDPCVLEGTLAELSSCNSISISMHGFIFWLEWNDCTRGMAEWVLLKLLRGGSRLSMR